MAAAVPALALLLVVAVVGRTLWFFSDDWNIYADYHSGNLLEPFNGHLSLVPAGIYQALFHTVGVGSYTPFRLVGLAAMSVLGFQVLRYARDRVGRWVAIVVVTAVMWNSFGTTNVMFPFLLNFSLPIAALVAMWWHLDRDTESPSTLHLAAVAAWLTLALGASGLGVMALGALVAESALRRSHLRRWVAIGIPAAVWFLWWVLHREANDISDDLSGVVTYALRMIWAGATSVAAGSRSGGVVVLGLAGVLVVSGAARWRDDPTGWSDGDSPAPRVLGAAAAALSFAGLTALTRQDVTPSIPPDELRYGWTIGAYIVLGIVSVWRPLPRSTDGKSADHDAVDDPDVVRRRATPGRGAVAAVAVLAFVVLSIGGVRLVDGMDDWADQVADAAPGLRSNLYAAEAVGAERMDPSAVIRPLSFVLVGAPDYLDAVADVGSPLAGADTSEIGGRADQRQAADDLLFSSLRLELGAVDTGGSDCRTEREAGPGTTVVIVPAGGGNEGEVGAGQVTVRRFADDATVELAVPPGFGPRSLELPADAPVATDVAVPYTVEGTGGIRICGS